MQPRHRGKMQATAWAEVLREIGYWVRDDVDVVDRLLSEEIERRWEEKNVNGKWCKVPTRAQGHGTAIEGCSQLYGGGN